MRLPRLQDDCSRLSLEVGNHQERLKENQEKIKMNKQLPYLVGNVIEVLNAPEEDEEDGANQLDEGQPQSGKCVVLKTSTRQTIFLPVVGLVDPLELKPGDLVGVNKDS